LDDSNNGSKFCSHIKANVNRRLKLLYRDKKGFLLEILCPIILIIIGAFISKINFFIHTEDFSTDDISKTGNQVIYYGISGNVDNSDLNKFYFNYNGITIKQDINNNQYDFNIDGFKKFIDRIYGENKNNESYQGHYVDMKKKDYIGCYSSYLFSKIPKNDREYEFLELINARMTQGVPVYTAKMLETIVAEELKNNNSNNKLNIKFKNKILPETYEQNQQSNMDHFIICIFFSIAYSLIPSNFIFIIVRERNNNSKHLMRLSGLNIFAYWIVNFLFELLKYYVVGGICILVVYLFDFDAPYLILFYLINGPTLIFFIYFMSFFFTNETTAQNAILLLNVMVGVLAPPVVVFLRMKDSTANIGKIFENSQIIFPSSALACSYFISFIKEIIYKVEYGITQFDKKELVKKFILLKGPLIFLCSEFVIYSVSLILMEVFSYRNPGEKNKNNILMEDESKITDEGVLREEQKVSNINPISSNNNISNNIIKLDDDSLKKNLIEAKSEEVENVSEYMITIKHLRKEYNNGLYNIFSCCCKKQGKVAVKNLSFCLEKGECFGLLGLNGAGKTTTFKCITQELYPTNGEIIFNGVNLDNNFGYIINKFGYCPQYDAIFEYLTVYENLEFYSILKGVKREFLSQIITALIKEMRLQEFTNKIAGRLSGGNKRKLSVAISMLCNPPLILLDEPSTGMDPEARRFMWSVIHKMSKKGKKSSVIMTTHSMDEAETLCKRMAIMVNGEFVCLGKANEIKEKYGYGYELNLRIKPMTEEQENKLYYSKYNIDNHVIVNRENLTEILGLIGRENYQNEVSEGRLGAKLLRDIDKNNGVNIRVLINWIFYVENAVKFVKEGYDNFAKIIIKENMDNNFLFKMKKKPKDSKSIGYLFGLYESHKEKCFITEYSIQQTSLEQIFNQFSQQQMSNMVERRSTIVEPGDVENIMSSNKNEIVLNKKLISDLLNDDE
jgi:ATP-binding cassette subfamily A (ABC1) protein 3